MNRMPANPLAHWTGYGYGTYLRTEARRLKKVRAARARRAAMRRESQS